MDKHIEDVIAHIKNNEGDVFKHDEHAILQAYQRNKDNRSSISIKILSMVGGLLGTLAFIAFLFIAGLYDSKTGMVAFGIGFIVGSIFLNYKYTDKLIIDTSTISMYIIGFALLVFGLAEMNVNGNVISLVVMLLAFSVLFINQNYILAFISVLIINGSLLSLLMINDIYDLIHLYISMLSLFMAYFFLNEAKLITQNKIWSKLYNPIRIALIFSFLGGLAFVAKRGLAPLNPDYIWLSSLINIIVVLYLVKSILSILQINILRNQIIIYAIIVMLLLLTAYSPAISGAIVILLLCFYVNYKTGLAIGVVAFIYFISQYYYDLNMTLLVKSLILFSSGILFLLFYFLMQKLRS